jgi:uncharacterized protein involved in type VI secretion and phage assembly
MSAQPRSRSTDKRYYGVVEAIVTDNEDPLKEGRVRVNFPMLDNKVESEWCRVRQAYAGNDYGAFFIPEVGDEVLVSFIHGDMRLPIILGGLYNGKDKPPSARAKDKDQKMIRTRGQHEILMDDTTGKERVRVKTKQGHTIDLSDEEKKIDIKTTSGQKVVLDDQANKVTIETGGTSITVDAASGTITLTATTISLSATSVKLGGDAAVQSVVLGEMLLTLFNTHTHTTGVPGFPTSPPIIPLTPAVLSKTSKTS